MKPERGIFLSALIVIYGLAITFASVLLIFGQGVRDLLGLLPEWFGPYVAALLIGRLVALVAIWYFRRWGVFVLLLLECIEVGFGLFIFTGYFSFALRVAVALPALIILVLIWFLALRSKWPQFR